MRSLQVEILDADIPLLIGLDFMDHMRVTANSLTNRLECADGWSIPLTRYGSHIYLEWGVCHNQFPLEVSGGPRGTRLQENRPKEGNSSGRSGVPTPLDRENRG
jgi:hypothetical protein